MKHIPRPPIDDNSDIGKNSPLRIIPYLPDEECFFDSRHWTYGLLADVLPFALTTRVNENNQQFLKVLVDDNDLQQTKPFARGDAM